MALFTVIYEFNVSKQSFHGLFYSYLYINCHLTVIFGGIYSYLHYNCHLTVILSVVHSYLHIYCHLTVIFSIIYRYLQFNCHFTVIYERYLELFTHLLSFNSQDRALFTVKLKGLILWNSRG
jgi:hypothetical protein